MCITPVYLNNRQWRFLSNAAFGLILNLLRNLSEAGKPLIFSTIQSSKSMFCKSKQRSEIAQTKVFDAKFKPRKVFIFFSYSLIHCSGYVSQIDIILSTKALSLLTIVIAPKKAALYFIEPKLNIVIVARELPLKTSRPRHDYAQSSIISTPLLSKRSA